MSSTPVRWLFGDQLGPHFLDDHGGRVLMVESKAVFRRRRFHRAKAHLVLSAMRHRAAQLGDRMTYVRGDGYAAAVREQVGDSPVEVIHPTSYAALRLVERLAAELNLSVLPPRGFATSREDLLVVPRPEPREAVEQRADARAGAGTGPFGARCFYCNAALERDNPIDHVLLWSLLGIDGLANLVQACRRCNGDKRHSLPAPSIIDRVLGRDRDVLEDIATTLEWPTQYDRTVAAARGIYLSQPEGSPTWAGVRSSRRLDLGFPHWWLSAVLS